MKYVICRGHIPSRAHYRHCMAVSLQRRLKARSWEAGQSQGIIDTDAPKSVVDEIVLVMEETRSDWHRWS